MGAYLQKRLTEESQTLPLSRIRGLGLMQAFDLPTKATRNDVILEALTHGLIVLGCGAQGIRLIPSYIVGKAEIEEALGILTRSIKTCTRTRFRHQGKICTFITCGDINS